MLPHKAYLSKESIEVDEKVADDLLPIRKEFRESVTAATKRAIRDMVSYASQDNPAFTIDMASGIVVSMLLAEGVKVINAGICAAAPEWCRNELAESDLDWEPMLDAISIALDVLVTAVMEQLQKTQHAIAERIQGQN